MYRVINRLKGQITLSSGVIIAAQRSVIVDEIDEHLDNLKKSKVITIHKLQDKDYIWKSFDVDLSGIKGINAPNIVTVENTEKRYGGLALAFENGRDSEIGFEVELPPNYVRNSNLKPSIDWNIINKGNYGNVTWIVEFSAKNNWIVFKNDALYYSLPIPLQENHVKINLPTIQGAGFKYSTIVKGKLIRKGSKDTFDLPVIIPSFSIQYQITKEKVVKWSAR